MAHSYRTSSLRRPLAEINVVPFIDVMLVLLIIFMVTAPFLTQAIKVNLPSQATAPQSTALQTSPLIVTIDSIGRFYFNIADFPNQPISKLRLKQLIQEQLLKKTGLNPITPPKRVFVRGDQNVHYQHILTAILLLQQAGVKQVGLLTQVKEPFQEAPH